MSDTSPGNGGERADGTTSRGWLAGAACAACVSTFLVLFPVLHNAWTNWDDTEILLNNPWWRGFRLDHLAWMFSGVRLGHYQPLTWLSYAVDHSLWGLNSAGVHLGSLGLHSLSAGLLVVALARWVRRRGGACAPGDAGALAMAALTGAWVWSLHPLRVEAVAWATARRDVLSGLCLLASLVVWLGGEREDGAPSARRSLAAFAWFVAALLAKAQAFVFPVLLLVLDADLGRRGREEPAVCFVLRMTREKGFFFAAAALFAVSASLAAQSSGAMISLQTHGVAARAVQALGAISFYAAKTVAPVGLTPLVPLARPFDPLAPEHLLPALVAAVALGAVALAARRRPGLALAAAFAVVALGPVLGFAQSGPQAAADRYAYVAAWSVSGLVAAGTFALIRRLRDRPAWARPAAVALSAAAVGVVVGMAQLSRAQARVWKDSWTLWTHALTLHPHSALALNNRGHALEEAGALGDALDSYGAAAAADPSLAMPLASRATLRALLGDAAGARSDFEAALRRNPAHVESINGLGNLDRMDGRLDAAEARYREAIRLRPAYADAWYNLGTVQLHTGEFDDARHALETAVRFAPLHALAWHNLGVSLQRLGHREGALTAYRRALDLDPSLGALFKPSGSGGDESPDDPGPGPSSEAPKGAAPGSEPDR